MSISTENFNYVTSFVRDGSGIVLEEEKLYLVEARLGPLSRREGCDSIDQLCQRLRSNGNRDLGQKVLDAMTTNETSWFRDVAPFEALRSTILPELIGSRGDRKKLSIWCAACSTGQEPYSISMILRETLPDFKEWRISLLATDISTEVLAKAKLGRYSQLEANRGLPVTQLVQYFDKDGTHWQVKPEILEMVEWRHLNLKENMPALSGPFDVIFCRNVLIYFDVPTKRTIIENMCRVLRSDGYLLFGTAESPYYTDGLLKRVRMGKATSYQVNNNQD